MDYSTKALQMTGADDDARRVAAMQESLAQSAGGESKEKVAGTKLDQKPVQETRQELEPPATKPQLWKYAAATLLALLLAAGFFKKSGAL
ncbi:hypothetical protein [Verrucomicrobium spinosum]|uniref:hypothetical protein n=1 Tax=Verrucomicrobium spinosum TaxID=2736 RepID=UPI000A7DB212|nr:hypothetical protein [Verrucomicrobium spinosum]